MKKKVLLTLGFIAFTTMGVINTPNISNASEVDKEMIMELEECGETHYEIETVEDLKVLAEQWQGYMEENPNASTKKQDAFLNNYIKEQGFKDSNIKQFGSSVGDYLPGYNNLNDKEKKLAKKHPAQAVKVYLCAQKATDLTIQNYGNNGYQDNSDAFRHCCWNALMKKSIGEKAAEQWATAHEAEASGIDKQMDLHNNSIGRGINVDGKSESQIATSVKSKVKNGKCKRIVNNKLVATDGTGLK